jgi:hypothetical protein
MGVPLEEVTGGGEGDEDAPAALRAPQPGKPVLEQAALEELPQDALDDRSQGSVGASEPRGPHTQQLLEVLFDETEQRRPPGAATAGRRDQ